MTCDKFRQMLDNYESLTENEKLIMTAHIAQCHSCRSEMDFMLSIIGTAKSLPEIEPPEDFLYKLNMRIDLEEVRERRFERNQRRMIRTNWKRYGSLAACLLLISIIGTNGKSLVSRINDSDNGVIIQETVLHNKEAVKDEGIENSEQVTEENPAAEQENIVLPDAEATQLPDTSGISTSSPVNSRPASQVVTPSPVQTPKQTSSVYASNNVEALTPPPTVATSTPSSEPYTIAKEEYRIPIESIPYGNRDDEEEKKSTNGYSLAEEKAPLALGMYTPIDKDGNPTDFEFDESRAAVVPSSSSILVSSKDEEKVKSLMNRYITGNYGIYYMTTENRLNEFFEEMDKAGINYEKFINNSLERVSFKLVVIS